MIALILAAGYGTRLYPLTLKTPKALLPVKERPILQYLTDKLCHPELKVRELVFVSNHRYCPAFKEWLTQVRLPLRWVLMDDHSTSEENRLGSMGDLEYALRTHGINEDLLVIGSDNLFQDPLLEFLPFAKEKSPAVTLGVTELPDRAQAHRYGVVQLDGTYRILGFQEKPKDPPPSPFVSAAIYFFPKPALPSVLEYAGLPQGDRDTLGKFIHWLIQRQRAYAFPLFGTWFDIGDLSSYTKAKEQFTP